MKQKYIWLLGSILLVVGLTLTAFFSFAGPGSRAKDKVFVAAEDAGRVDVINVASRSVINKIDLSDNGMPYMAHNVQVSPDSKAIWVTANTMDMDAMMMSDSSGGGEHHHRAEGTPDQVVVIDPKTDSIKHRIDVDSELHLAHIVLTPDSKFALVDSQNNGTIYKIDTATFTVVGKAQLKLSSQPHGMRISPDGTSAYVALMGDKSIAKLNIASLSVQYIQVDGVPVQTGVTADGKYVLASIITRRSVAVIDTADSSVRYIDLPSDSQGPLQLYLSPDSRFVYVADQGDYLDSPAGQNLYKIDLRTARSIKTIRVGTAPHGVVVSPDGNYTYVTNLNSNDVSVVDNTTNTEIARIPVGKKPNGITYWSHE